MLKQRNEQIQFAVRVIDVIVCVAAFLLAYWLRTQSWIAREGSVLPLDALSWMLAASLGIHFLLYPFFGFYHSLRLKSIFDIIWMTLKSFLAEFFMLGALVFFVQAKETSRYFFLLFLSMNYTLVLVEKIGIRTLVASIRRRGYNYRQVLIIGTGHNAQRVIAALRKNKHWGYIPFGLLIAPGETVSGKEIDRVPVLGSLSDLTQLIHDRAVDEVYFAPDRFDSRELSEEVSLCEKLGIPARFSISLFDLPQSKAAFTHLDTIPVVTFYTTLMTPMEAFVKRLMDILIALIGLSITTVLYPWISWRIRRESPGPVIFKQIRVGENGRRFKCYKFRTMYLDAEDRKKDLLADNLMQGPLFKIENDPRIIPFGHFLRRTSLDELPQFFNILRGDMSVVGTRPPTPDEVAKYETHYRRRLSIRPGLTGLWQVSGRNEIRNFEDVLALDLKYIDNWSIWLDIQIIARTLWVALFKRGAY